MTRSRVTRAAMPCGAGRATTRSRAARARTRSLPAQGLDVLEGGPANDRLYSGERDGLPDVVDCGDGRDRAVVRVGDVAVDCERVRVLPARHPRVVFQRGTRGDDALTGRQARLHPRARRRTTWFPGSAPRTSSSARRGRTSLKGRRRRRPAWGGSEDDTSNGGEASDWLWGGGGADTAVRAGRERPSLRSSRRRDGRHPRLRRARGRSRPCSDPARRHRRELRARPHPRLARGAQGTGPVPPGPVRLPAGWSVSRVRCNACHMGALFRVRSKAGGGMGCP